MFIARHGYLQLSLLRTFRVQVILISTLHSELLTGSLSKDARFVFAYHVISRSVLVHGWGNPFFRSVVGVLPYLKLCESAT
jgi:hypothetical protein